MRLEIFIKLLLTICCFLIEIEFLLYIKEQKLNNDTYLYWAEKGSEKINGRFLRQELFALNNQFLR